MNSATVITGSKSKYILILSDLYTCKTHSKGFHMAEKPIEELLRKYLGISIPRLVMGVLMIIFAALILMKPELLAYIIALYLLVSGMLVIIDEVIKKR